MRKDYWLPSDIYKMYDLANRGFSKHYIAKMEKEGKIPAPILTKKGAINTRIWKNFQLPLIGEQLGFIKKVPGSKSKVLTVYTSKGGVLKTTISYNLARILALHNIKVLIIGLDVQCSITDAALPTVNPNSSEHHATELDVAKDAALLGIDLSEVVSDLSKNNAVEHALVESGLSVNHASVDAENFNGLYSFFYENKSIEDLIVKTDLPTLDVIPETADLGRLERSLRAEKDSSFMIKNKLLPLLGEYQIIIFDNGPSWSCLVENSLTSADYVLSPIGCNVTSYRALKSNLENITEFRNHFKLKWEGPFLIPTLLDSNKTSMGIHAHYLKEYENTMHFNIKKNTKGENSILYSVSCIEHAPTSTLAKEYRGLAQEVWDKINK